MGREEFMPRLYLFTPVIEDAAAFVPALDRALPTADIAAVLLRLGDADERALINRIKSVAAVVQRRDIALLIEGRPELVARAGADGAHLTGVAALRAALPALKPDRIVGAGGLRSRDDAMLAGETEADYVMFGEPEWRGSGGSGEHRGGKSPPFAAIEERVAWWAELFQPPCIGYAANADEIRPLAQAGADFVALGEWIWSEEGGVERILAAAAASLAAAPG
jgi:thiamine-phosphate pyrophosphorylase